MPTPAEPLDPRWLLAQGGFDPRLPRLTLHPDQYEQFLDVLVRDATSDLDDPAVVVEATWHLLASLPSGRLYARTLTG